MRQTGPRLLRATSDRNPGSKKQGTRPAAESPLVSATDTDALSRPEPGTKSKQTHRIQPRKNHERVGEKGQKVQVVNRIQTRSSTVRDKLAGKHAELRTTRTVKPSTSVTTPQASYRVSPNPTSSTVRERQQVLLKQEAEKKRKACDEYDATGDPNVFAPFLAPFISASRTGQHGKRRRLGEWQWDREVERHWREDKTAGQPGARIWAPVEESFL
ncbi:hypothetical protein B0T21DRAFT_285273 [Apiosordaria backusii]|uniref:Uncharacterized protein n=1 Tax=Apiosordaria backusii TaxID=314023 RepID=A0AA40BRQ1_9PEZI|nr:hypothetical protein B0T21DRAFT_285273 [Apiosordaria backusii]